MLDRVVFKFYLAGYPSLSHEEIGIKKIRLNKTLRVIFGQYENKTYGLTKLNVSLSFPILN